MDTEVRRIHYYHADATALAGHIRRPFDLPIKVQAPVSLPPVGGFVAARGRKPHKDSKERSIVSFEAAHSHVSGSVEKENGAFTTQVTSTVEKFNVLDTFTADRLVAQISLDHPRKGYIPTVSLIGTQFENVRIGGDPVEIILDLDICQHSNEGEYPTQRCMYDRQFLTKVGEQYRRINDATCMPDWIIEDRTVPNWVKQRYQWDDSEAALHEKGHVLCSIVKEIRGKFSGKHYHNIIEIPDFGKIFLGELIVDYTSYQLIMTRLELGSPTEACISAAVGKANGQGGGG
jgi:hypothetical protein